MVPKVTAASFIFILLQKSSSPLLSDRSKPLRSNPVPPQSCKCSWVSSEPWAQNLWWAILRSWSIADSKQQQSSDIITICSLNNLILNANSWEFFTSLAIHNAVLKWIFWFVWKCWFQKRNCAVSVKLWRPDDEKWEWRLLHLPQPHNGVPHGEWMHRKSSQWDWASSWILCRARWLHVWRLGLCHGVSPGDWAP